MLKITKKSKNEACRAGMGVKYRFCAVCSVLLFHVCPLEDIFTEHGLSVREMEVATLLIKEGLSNEEIGNRLFISPETIKSHFKQIYRKFGVKNRAAFLAKVLGK